MYFSWIIPTYNAEKIIAKTLREVDAYLKSRALAGGYEIIVAYSKSKDHTAEIVKNLQTQIPALKFLDLENKGKGWAVKQGMLRAQGEIRIFSDADNSTAPEYFDAMLPFFQKGFNIVMSSRHPKDASGASRDVKEPMLRELLGGMGNLIIQFLGVWGIWDTQNGFKAFSAVSAQKLFGMSRMCGFAFDVEILALARLLKYQIAIIPIRWKYGPESTVTFKDYLKFFVDVFKIRWFLLTNIYKL